MWTLTMGVVGDKTRVSTVVAHKPFMGERRRLCWGTGLCWGAWLARAYFDAGVWLGGAGL